MSEDQIPENFPGDENRNIGAGPVLPPSASAAGNVFMAPPTGAPYSGYANPHPYGPPAQVGAPAVPGGRKGLGAGKAVALTAAVALFVGGIGGYAGYEIAHETAGTSPSVTIGKVRTNSNSPTTGDLSPRANNSIAQIAESVLPSVVSIDVESGSGGGTGSGFIVREDGYIITNNHVVFGAGKNSTITVTLNDGTEKPATVVGANAAYDLAVLKIDGTGLPVVALGNSADLKVGDETVAIGSPLGLSGTVTSGIVSALNRPVTAGDSGQNTAGQEPSFISAIQTDAAINPGNSGGPLVNSRAEVIGVNSAIATLGASSAMGGESGSIGLGFAIPMSTAKRVAEEIIATGKSTTTTLGIKLDTSQGDTAAVVTDVTPGSGAANAGLEKGDTIIAVDKKPVTDSLSLITLVRSYAPGDTVTLTVKNTQGKTSDITATLGSS